jgi:hypothetical protein
MFDPVWPEKWIWSCDATRGAGDNEANEMPRVVDSFRFVLMAVAGWMNQRQLQMTDYLAGGKAGLREQLGARRMRLNNDQLTEPKPGRRWNRVQIAPRKPLVDVEFVWVYFSLSGEEVPLSGAHPGRNRESIPV